MKITKSALRKLVLEQMQTVEEDAIDDAMEKANDKLHISVDSFNDTWKAADEIVDGFYKEFNLFDGVAINAQSQTIDDNNLTSADADDIITITNAFKILKKAKEALSALRGKIDVEY